MAGHRSARSQGAFTLTVDGNDAPAVFAAASEARARCLAGEGPVFLVCETFRMKGHAEHDDQRYVDPELLAHWAKLDPLLRLEAWLKDRGWAPDPDLAERLEAEAARQAE